MISFLFSSGAIKATKTIHANDLKVGIPNLLICIEMAIFGTLHLWAFAWQPYSSSHLQDDAVTDFYGNGKATYYGGPFGAKALLDALNPLDLIKAISRGIRWLFVGRKKRTLDKSYQNTDPIGLDPTKPSSPSATAYQGPGNMVSGGRTARYGSTPDEEGQVLLNHAQSNPTTAYNRLSGDLGIAPSPDEIENDGRYYSSNRLSTSSLLDPAMHPQRPYSPYADHDHDHNPYLTPSDPDYPPRYIPGQEMGVTTYHSRNSSLQLQDPIPMSEAYHPPPLYDDDYEHHGRR